MRCTTTGKQALGFPISENAHEGGVEDAWDANCSESHKRPVSLFFYRLKTVAPKPNLLTRNCEGKLFCIPSVFRW
jgi:hypothetical protein